MNIVTILWAEYPLIVAQPQKGSVLKDESLHTKLPRNRYSKKFGRNVYVSNVPFRVHKHAVLGEPKRRSATFIIAFEEVQNAF